MLSWESKYDIVGKRVQGLSGTLVDVGARDKRLQGHLPEGMSYLSADTHSGHDLLWNLENPIEAQDGQYDIVVALDVLEHIERIHEAYKELIRITRNRLFISLPNMTCLSMRLKFLQTGSLGGKYDLMAEHQGDRHRWLTRYDQMCDFIGHHALANGCEVRQYDILLGFGRFHSKIARMPLSPALRAYTVLFEIVRRPS